LTLKDARDPFKRDNQKEKLALRDARHPLKGIS
jgi:hypothetical protein